MHSLTRAIIIAATLTVATTFAAHSEEKVDVSSHPWIGEAAPSFELEQLSGVTLGLEQLKGKYVVIHFGASW